ncbi:down syndrome cell adhesion molecule-like protein Dscam2 [Caerostris extrusa]|uniref:Down syndrome cell adhesion molecule-like protein Dscam2 n=1 Tax=Caerostris extrusa TaxID=172846 RepID=A0AAV4RVN3_CAEEX|nr:down syndrome cell adhesion molecule-like protein Dscam2 [Caerostris extrusa]
MNVSYVVWKFNNWLIFNITHSQAQLVLRCDVSGDIPLTINWAKANRNLPLISEDRIKIQEDSSLENSSSSVIIRNTAAEDTGLYICTARNTYGQSQATIRLKVNNQQLPLNFQVSEIWCKSVRLKWKQPYNGNSPLKYYIIRYKRKDSPVKPTETKVPDSPELCGDPRPASERHLQFSRDSCERRTQEPAVPPPRCTPPLARKEDFYYLGSLLPWTSGTGISSAFPSVTRGCLTVLRSLCLSPTKSLPVSLSLAHPGLEASASREYEVCGLQESSSYTVVVQAMTSAGIGPASEPVLVKTSYGGTEFSSPTSLLFYSITSPVLLQNSTNIPAFPISLAKDEFLTSRSYSSFDAIQESSSLLAPTKESKRSSMSH